MIVPGHGSSEKLKVALCWLQHFDGHLAKYPGSVEPGFRDSEEVKTSVRNYRSPARSAAHYGKVEVMFSLNSFSHQLWALDQSAVVRLEAMLQKETSKFMSGVLGQWSDSTTGLRKEGEIK
jgi:hypothetical protein